MKFFNTHGLLFLFVLVLNLSTQTLAYVSQGSQTKKTIERKTIYHDNLEAMPTNPAEAIAKIKPRTPTIDPIHHDFEILLNQNLKTNILMVPTIVTGPTECWGSQNESTYCPDDEHLPTNCTAVEFTKPTHCPNGEVKSTTCPDGEQVPTTCTNRPFILPTNCPESILVTSCVNSSGDRVIVPTHCSVLKVESTRCPKMRVATFCSIRDTIVPTYCPYQIIKPTECIFQIYPTHCPDGEMASTNCPEDRVMATFCLIDDNSSTIPTFCPLDEIGMVEPTFCPGEETAATYCEDLTFPTVCPDRLVTCE